MLEVVEEQEHLTLPDALGDAVRRPDRLRDRRGDKRRVAKRGQTHPEHACLVGGDERPGSLEREARLARAAGASESDKARSALDEREHVFELGAATDEGARGPRQVRVRDRLEGREACIPKLEDRDRTVDVLQAVLAEVNEREAVEKYSGRLREHDLAAVSRGGDPRREMNVVSHVALVGDERGPCVQADAQVDRAGCEGGSSSSALRPRLPEPRERRRRKRPPACRPRRRVRRRTPL